MSSRSRLEDFTERRKLAASAPRARGPSSEYGTLAAKRCRGTLRGVVRTQELEDGFHLRNLKELREQSVSHGTWLMNAGLESVHRYALPKYEGAPEGNRSIASSGSNWRSSSHGDLLSEVASSESFWDSVESFVPDEQGSLRRRQNSFEASGSVGGRTNRSHRRGGTAASVAASDLVSELGCGRSELSFTRFAAPEPMAPPSDPYETRKYGNQLGDHLGVHTLPANPYRKRMRRVPGKMDDPHGFALQNAVAMSSATGEDRQQRTFANQLPLVPAPRGPSAARGAGLAQHRAALTGGGVMDRAGRNHILTSVSQSWHGAPRVIADTAKKVYLRYQQRSREVAALLKYLDAYGLHGTRFPTEEVGNPEDEPHVGQEMVWALSRRLRRTATENSMPMELSRGQVMSILSSSLPGYPEESLHRLYSCFETRIESPAARLSRVHVAAFGSAIVLGYRPAMQGFLAMVGIDKSSHDAIGLTAVRALLRLWDRDLAPITNFYRAPDGTLLRTAEAKLKEESGDGPWDDAKLSKDLFTPMAGGPGPIRKAYDTGLPDSALLPEAAARVVPEEKLAEVFTTCCLSQAEDHTIRGLVREIFGDPMTDGAALSVNGSLMRSTRGVSEAFVVEALRGGHRAGPELLREFTLQLKAYQKHIGGMYK
mmetsp:Transcript_12702/g.38089  ORF Transcript_12702/g.38089 Transcript_12702/m.38089 type:complete len:654 (-) Transcript_12702:247-2208(-)